MVPSPLPSRFTNNPLGLAVMRRPSACDGSQLQPLPAPRRPGDSEDRASADPKKPLGEASEEDSGDARRARAYRRRSGRPRPRRRPSRSRRRVPVRAPDDEVPLDAAPRSRQTCRWILICRSSSSPNACHERAGQKLVTVRCDDVATAGLDQAESCLQRRIRLIGAVGGPDDRLGHLDRPWSEEPHVSRMRRAAASASGAVRIVDSVKY